MKWEGAVERLTGRLAMVMMIVMTVHTNETDCAVEKEVFLPTQEF